MNCTIYVRFSNQEQAQGDSRRRQLTLCQEMATRHGWAHGPDSVIIDEGKSAFTGLNRAEGSGLGQFEADVRAGKYINDGHVLVVENLDRISRQGHDAILPFLNEMTRNGVTVATVDGDRIYRAHERVELGPVIEAVVKAELAREESEKKSRRLRAAQQRKVQLAQEYAAKGLYIATTKVVPAWIDVDPLTYEMSLNERRAAIVREIFQLTIDGFGTPAIMKKLNARGEPVWSNRGICSKHGWSVGYLTKLVTNPAVIGEARPMNKPRHSKATSKDIVIFNRYPKVVDAATFYRAQKARQSRKNTSGAWQITHGNIFSGIAKCQVCGGRMQQLVTARKGQLRRSGRGQQAYPARQDFSYLGCHNAINRVTDEGTGHLKCSNLAKVRYETLERGVLETALYFAANERAPAERAVTALEIEIADGQRQIDELQRRVNNLVDTLSRAPSPAVERQLMMMEDDLRLLRKAQTARCTERNASVHFTEEDHLHLVRKIREELDSEDDEVRRDARVRMKQVLRRIIKRMSSNEDRETLVILGEDALALVFDDKGNLIDHAALRIWGPNGEPDWHPDDEARLEAA